MASGLTDNASRGPLRGWVRSWPFRRQMMVLFTALFTLTTLGDYLAGRSMRTSVLHAEVEDKLQSTVIALENLVRSSVESSISSYLQGVVKSSVAFGNQALVDGKKAGYQQLLITLKSQKVARWGYVFILDQKGSILMHPRSELIGRSISTFPNAPSNLNFDKGSLTSERWLEPGEESLEPKLLVGSRLESNGWMICAVASRRDFEDLVDMETFRARFLSVRFGERGYPFILDSKGVLLIHPFMEGSNIRDYKDDMGRIIYQEMFSKQNGRIEYTWKNPEDAEARPKVVVFRHLPELNWIVASSCDIKDLRKSESTFAYLQFTYLAILLLLALAATYVLSRSLSQPIGDLAKRLESPDFAATEPIHAGGSREISILTKGFNTFIARITQDRKELADSESRHRALFEHAVEGIFESTRDGRYLRLNPRLARMMGYSTPKEAIETVSNIARQVYQNASDRDRIWTDIETSGSVLDRELELVRKDGSTILVQLNARALRSEDGELRMEGFIRDITDERQTQIALAKERQELESRVVSRTRELQEGIQKLERQNVEIAELHALTEMLQACRDLSETRSVLASFLKTLFPQATWYLHLLDPEDGQLVNWVRSEHATTVSVFPVDACWALRSGKPYVRAHHLGRPSCSHEPQEDQHAHICLPIQGSGHLHGLLHLLFEPEEDLAELGRRANHLAERLTLAFTNLKLRLSLEEQSIRDPLTGCHNRRYLLETAIRELRRAERGGHSLGLGILDLDHFKKLNDTYGHDAGDAVLRQLAHFLSNSLRDSDIVIRYGGEEFLILLPEADLAATFARIDGIRQRVADELRIDYRTELLSVTLSAGVSAYPDSGTTLEDLIKTADLRLYEAKSRGRNQTVAGS